MDEAIQNLAMEAKRHPPQSKERQLALTKLIETIAHSGKLCRPRQGQFSHVYEDIYAEALSQLWLFVCQHIERYDPDRASFIYWLNYLLKKRFIVEAIKIVVGKQDIMITSSDEIEQIPQDEAEPFTSDLLRQYIFEDPENRLKQKRLRNHPTFTFQTLLKWRMEGRKWKDISAQTGVKLATLSDFYQRELKQVHSILKDYLNS
ncbi:hypothetical protein [Laspinema olomoucense]|uniref:hypothetical protein n=1 Tax=Laspinema olomoucense TaxID=3231600 RepID=UPI0021BA92AF|nr:hypothetical protein [Laspinema sp. D3d]MCT7973690.1 hypothetical protein [Laspinema sp. D3d]